MLLVIAIESKPLVCFLSTTLALLNNRVGLVEIVWCNFF